MTDKILLIEPHDPVIFRDGRPFANGLPASTLAFPPPSATAGAIRSRSAENIDFEDDNRLDELLRIRQVGPFPASFDAASGKWQLAFAAPADALPYKLGRKIEYQPLRLHPNPPPGGCDLPGGMKPLFGARPEKVDEEAPRFWRAPFMVDWLAKPEIRTVEPHDIGFGGLNVQTRTHVAIDADTLLGQDHMLFSTGGLEFTWPAKREGQHRLQAQRAALVSRVIAGNGLEFPALAPLGGERRLATWNLLSSSNIDWPQPPKITGKLIRAVLATPAIFTQGWRPSWTEHPDIPGLKLTLVSAAIPRFHAVSGWDLHKARRGPKPTRFMAPAGSVYYFECTGDPTALWMQSICDHPQDRLDGFGIVLIGDC